MNTSRGRHVLDAVYVLVTDPEPLFFSPFIHVFVFMSDYLPAIEVLIHTQRPYCNQKIKQ